jgi:hypothetical protein
MHMAQGQQVRLLIPQLQRFLPANNRLQLLAHTLGWLLPVFFLFLWLPLAEAVQVVVLIQHTAVVVVVVLGWCMEILFLLPLATHTPYLLALAAQAVALITGLVEQILISVLLVFYALLADQVEPLVLMVVVVVLEALLLALQKQVAVTAALAVDTPAPTQLPSAAVAAEQVDTLVQVAQGSLGVALQQFLQPLVAAAAVAGVNVVTAVTPEPDSLEAVAVVQTFLALVPMARLVLAQGLVVAVEAALTVVRVRLALRLLVLMAVAVAAMVVAVAVRGIIIRLEESGVMERFVSSGPARPVYFHPQIRGICNA